MDSSEQERFERLGVEIKEADAAVRAAEKAIDEYLAVHPNAHAVHVVRGGLAVRLNAMDADPALSALEASRDEAKLQFVHAQQEFADLKKLLYPEKVYIGGIKQR